MKHLTLIPILLLAACASTPRPAPSDWQPTLDASAWGCRWYCYGNVRFTGALTVDAPTAGDEFHFVVTPAPRPLIGKSFTITFNVAQQPLPNEPGCTTVPRLSPFLWRNGDTQSGSVYASDPKYQHYRWSAQAAYRVAMTPGPHTITVPLTVAGFKPVEGSWNQAELDDTLRNIAYIGMTVGSCSGAAHGAKGPAKFTVLDFKINR